MEATLPAVLEAVLGEIASTRGEAAPVPDELLLALKFIFGPSAVQALDLVDRRSVTRISSPSGRTVYQCKHLLATYLSLTMGLCQDLHVSNEQLSGILLAEEDQEQA